MFLTAFALQFAACVVYFVQAIELSKRGGPTELLGFVLGMYAVALYACMAALAIYFKRWAWRASIGAFAVHVVLGLVGSPSAIELGTIGVLALIGYFSIAAVGLWALLHNGSRSAVAA